VGFRALRARRSESHTRPGWFSTFRRRPCGGENPVSLRPRRPAAPPASAQRLGIALRGLSDRLAARRRRPSTAGTVSLAPCCAYELQSRQLIEELTRELTELRQRLNGLLFLIAGAIVADIVLRLARP